MPRSAVMPVWTNDRPRKIRNEGGYVLVLTIAALAILMLAGAFIGQRVSGTLQLAIAEKDRAEELAATQNALNQMVFLLATTQRFALGMGAPGQSVRFDGEWYDAGNGIAVAFVDSRAQLSVATPSRLWLGRLLASYGLSANDQDALLDTLEDYSDTDSLKRLQGAEAADYARVALPAPRNQPLVAEEELLRIYGWRQHAALWANDDDNLLQQLNVSSDTGVNPATASWRVLVAAFSLDPKAAASFVKQRNAADDLTVQNLANSLAPPLTGDNFMSFQRGVVFPGATTLVKLAPIGKSYGWEVSFTLTPESKEGGWQLRNFRSIRLSAAIAADKLRPMPDLKPFSAELQNLTTQMPF